MRLVHSTKVKKLKRYEAEFLAMKEQERNQVDPLERLQRENKALIENMLRSEHMITNLVLRKISAKETLAHVEEELSKKRHHSLKLRSSIRNLRKKPTLCKY